MKSRYIYKYLLAIVAGFVSALPALYLEKLFSLSPENSGVHYYIVFFDNFFLVSLIEELCKFLFIYLFFKFAKERKLLIYLGLCIGMGFSIFEEGYYSLNHDFDVKLMIPFFLHIFLAMIQMHILMKVQKDTINKYFYINLAWISTWLLHGVYDLSASLGNNWTWITLYGLIFLFTK